MAQRNPVTCPYRPSKRREATPLPRWRAGGCDTADVGSKRTGLGADAVRHRSAGSVLPQHKPARENDPTLPPGQRGKFPVGSGVPATRQSLSEMVLGSGLLMEGSADERTVRRLLTGSRESLHPRARGLACGGPLLRESGGRVTIERSVGPVAVVAPFRQASTTMRAPARDDELLDVEQFVRVWLLKDST